MNSDIWQFENNICRCCHSEGFFYNLAEPRPFCGEMEIYSDMIKDIFNIEIRPIPGPLCEITYTICMSCVFKLREAIQFKKQVQSCEDRFLDLYLKNKLKVFKKNDSAKAVVKQEPNLGKEDIMKNVKLFSEFKEEYLALEVDFHSNNDADQDFDVDNNEVKTERQTAISTKKGKGKGKGKPEETKEKAQPARIVKKEIEKKKVPVKKKDGKTPKFSLRPEDYTKSGDMYKCSRCDKEYNKKVSLRFHVKSKHYKIPRYVCEFCKKEFMTLAPFTVHKYEEHNVDDRFKCNACKGMFNSQLQLRKHTNNFHMLGEKYKCEFCDYESYSFESMYKHKFKHKTVKDYHCRFCRKAFLRKTTLDLHERIHTGDRRKICNECGQAFVQKSSLNYHMAKHHPEVNF